MKDGSICLLDWGYAGFFPRFYEVAAIEVYNDGYSEILREAVNETIGLTADELRCLDLIKRARSASMRMSL